MLTLNFAIANARLVTLAPGLSPERCFDRAVGSGSKQHIRSNMVVAGNGETFQVSPPLSKSFQKREKVR